MFHVRLQPFDRLSGSKLISDRGRGQWLNCATVLHNGHRTVPVSPWPSKSLSFAWQRIIHDNMMNCALVATKEAFLLVSAIMNCFFALDLFVPSFISSIPNGYTCTKNDIKDTTPNRLSHSCNPSVVSWFRPLSFKWPSPTSVQQTPFPLSLSLSVSEKKKLWQHLFYLL